MPTQKPRLTCVAANPQAEAAVAEPDSRSRRRRAVHRAAAELRRGDPVLLAGAEAAFVALAAETAGERGLAETAVLAAGEAMLVLAPTRAAALLRRPVESGAAAVALPLVLSGIGPAALRGLADPTAEQLLPPPEPLAGPPAIASAALALAKLARLLPAVLVAPARAEAAALAVDMQVMAVTAEDVLAAPIAAAALARVAEARVPLEEAADARVVAFREVDSGAEHFAILIGRPDEHPAPLVRLHSECFTGDLLGSLRCDCGPQLRGAIRRMAAEGAGVLLYLAQEGRGIGLANKLRAYVLQDRGLDTLDANRALGWGVDERNFLVAATMLENLGVRRVRLLTNNPAKVAALAECGIEVGREGHVIAPNGVNDQYLATKAARFGHLLT